MEACGEELAGVRADLKGVKKALRDGGNYLGLKGEQLQSYLLQLNQKENLLLSKQLQQMATEVPNGLGQVTPGAHGYEPTGPSAGAPGLAASAPEATTAVEAAPAPVPKEPPPGTPKAFDRNSLLSVVAHMCEYEAVPAESVRTLRALSSLAYADALAAGMDENALPQLIRLVRIHPDDAGVQLAAMRALCNMAYDQTVALKRLTAPEVMAVLLASMAGSPEPKEAGAKASEALARVVAAETRPENGPPPEAAAGRGGPGALGGLFVAASCGGAASWQGVVPRLVMQLISNEVLEAPAVAERFVAVAAQPSPLTAVGWLSLAKLFAACEVPDLPQMLCDAGAIAACAELMGVHLANAAVQLHGIEALSSLVGNRWAGLQAFANVGGMRCIEAAMRRHEGDEALQTKGIRALSSGVQWPEDVQTKSCYDGTRAMELTKAACSRHRDDQQLQVAALEALAKYIEKVQLAKDLAAAGGEQLTKAVMSHHKDVKKVQTFGRLVLDGLQRIV